MLAGASDHPTGWTAANSWYNRWPSHASLPAVNAVETRALAARIHRNPSEPIIHGEKNDGLQY